MQVLDDTTGMHALTLFPRPRCPSLVNRERAARTRSGQADPRRVCAEARLFLGFACSLLCALPAVAGGSGAAPAAWHADAVWRSSSPLASGYPYLVGLGAAQHDDATAAPQGYNWRGTAADKQDWGGVRRDVGYFLGYQFAAIAVLYVAPESISGWSREQKRNYSFDKWRNNVSQPVWDEDRWWINYVLHPYWGGASYIQARERGLDRAQAFWYAALLSTLFEYGAEALAEPVSAQDLVVTPVVGALVGEYLFTPLRQRIRAKPGKLDWSDKTLLFVTDPLGVVSAETDRLLGIKSTLRWQPIGMRIGTPGMDRDLSRTPAPVWGLQLRADW